MVGSDALWMMVFASGLVALGSAFSVAVALLQRGRYRSELKAVRAGRYPGPVAYQRYAQSRVAQLLAPALLLLVVALVVALTIWPSVFAGGDENPPPSTLTSITIGLAFAILLFALPFWLFALIVSTTAFAPALANLRGLPTRPRDLLALRLKAALGLVPTLAVIGAALVLVVLDVADWIPFTVLVAGLVLVLLIFGRVRASLVRWYYPSRPIEQTQWASLAARAAAWGERMGVRVRAVYVREMSKYGSGDTLVSGGRRNCTLFLSDTFLEASEWRQQDAMLCLSLGMIVGSRTQRVQRYLAFALLGFDVALLVALQFLFLIHAGGDSPATQLLITLGILLLLLVSLGGAIGLQIWRLTSRRSPNVVKDRVLRADQLAAEASGDPTAVMATINTAIALAGAAPGTRSVAGYPTALQRMQVLDQWAHQPGPRAPWAGQLVPCIVPVVLGPFVMTTRLTDEAKQEAPPPVPTAPYPVVGHLGMAAQMPVSAYPPTNQ